MTPTVWEHTITEPNGGVSKMLSYSEESPWSHWAQEYKDKCVYEGKPFYATVEVETLETIEARLLQIGYEAGNPATALHELIHDFQQLQAALREVVEYDRLCSEKLNGPYLNAEIRDHLGELLK